MFVLIILTVASTSQAQTRSGAVAGRVADTTARAVPGATVQLTGLQARD